MYSRNLWQRRKHKLINYLIKLNDIFLEASNPLGLELLLDCLRFILHCALYICVWQIADKFRCSRLTQIHINVIICSYIVIERWADYMDGSLSQEELDALLASMDTEQNSGQTEVLSDEEIDAIGEIANICAGSSATNLSTVLNQRVNITTPNVVLTTMDDILNEIEQPCVIVKINYVEGMHGGNVQILREEDAKIITDLMMGGDGTNLSALGDELSEMHMSALCEAMNQMTGACATSLNTMLGCKVDISPPTAQFMDLNNMEAYNNVLDFIEDSRFIAVGFRLEIGDLIDSSFMQLYPLDFAKSLYEKFSDNNFGMGTNEETTAGTAVPETKAEPAAEKNEPAAGNGLSSATESQAVAQQAYNNVPYAQQMQGMGQPDMMYGNSNVTNYSMPPISGFNVLPAEFSQFSQDIKPLEQTEEIQIIDDVSLEITVELGKTQKTVREILDFEEGSLVELNRFTGEMMDILVNGKTIAKGEIVVLEDKFAVQVKEINVDNGKNKRRNGHIL